MGATLADGLRDDLARTLPADGWSIDPFELTAYGRDWTRAFRPAPSAVVFPRTTAEVAEVVRLCRRHGAAMVPSGGRTGLAGGAVAEHGEVVISLERLAQLGEVDPRARTVVVGAGAVTERVHEHCAVHELTWPIELASKGSCQIGGNLATNAGGVRVIRYGHARRWALGLTVVTAQGEILELRPLEKDNTGVDLRELYLGSEGTLGIITQATLRLAPRPGRRVVALFAVSGIAAAMAILGLARRAGLVLSGFELWTEGCARRVEAHLGQRPPFAQPAAAYVLCEVEAAAPAAIAALCDEALAQPGVADGVVAESSAQAASLWRLRERISESLAATGTLHKNDVTLPLERLARFADEITAALAARFPAREVCLFGHVGDGNLHLNTLKPAGQSDEAFFAEAVAADHLVFARVAAHGGSISAEHGIGLVKKPFLGYSRSPAEIAVMKALKRALDPEGLLNPGKIFDL